MSDPAASSTSFGELQLKAVWHVGKQSLRLADLDRDRRIARAAQPVRTARQGRVETACGFQSTLTEAEATLARLRANQAEADAAEEALDTLEAAPVSETIAEKMAAEGFGPPIEARPADILARLKARASNCRKTPGRFSSSNEKE
ncbi:MAG: hypothetical protein ACRECP_06455 [Methylocella sp.]